MIASDLRGLLAFLRLEPYASDARICTALFRFDKESFRKLFNLICLRHTKGMVRNEIALPLQKRYVITMPFSAVEEQHYQSLFKNLTRACGLDTLGNPIAADWDFNDPAIQDSMRVALDRLRQTALHPEVGVHNRRALGRRAGPLRTVSEVLDAMLDHSEASIRTDKRSLLQIKLTRGQILAGLNRVQEARVVWEEVLKSSTALVSDCRDRLEQETKRARAQESDHSSADAEEEDKEETIPVEVKDARRRLRYALEIQHKAVFYCANAYFTIKSNIEVTPPDSDEFKALEKKETESYDLAKLIRKDILHDTHSKAKRLMDKIASTAAQQAFAVIPEFKSMDQKGIESRRIVDAFTELCGALDDQANQLDEWREHVIQLLLKPLLDEEHDDLTGEEYEDSTKLQDEITVYVQVLRTVVADRQDALSGQKNFLVDHEYKGAVRQAKEGEGAFPAKVLELFAIRDALNPQPIPGDPLSSLRGIVSELRAVSTKLRHEATDGNQRANAELTIVAKQLALAQSQLTEQTKATVALEQEIEQFTNSMNTRLDFYRQLQAVSDMVADYDGAKTDDSLAAQLKQEEAAQLALTTAEAKHRYRK
jgi:E3 ubiquitin-protein ligase SHPRH